MSSSVGSGPSTPRHPGKDNREHINREEPEFGLDWSEMPALGLQNEISLNYPEPRTMLQAFVVTLREGLEAFLIVAISLAYLKKTGRAALIPAVRWGIVASVLLSVGAGILLSKAANQALWEGVLALVAAVLVASLTVHMWRAGRYMKRDIEGRLEASSVKVGAAAFLGVFMFTLLMITREGMETALLMNALLFTVQSPQIISGAIGGTILAAFVAWLWSRYGHRVNLARFFQVTAVFLLIFVVQLLIYGFHELTEANIFPNSQPWHDATEPFGPDGIYGQYLTYLLVLLPLTWLAVSSFFHRGGPPRSQTA
jgi:high-affinity iron transporter